MPENNKELRLIVFGLIFSLAIILATSFISFPVAIINVAYGILIVTVLLLIKNLIDRRKK